MTNVPISFLGNIIASSNARSGSSGVSYSSPVASLRSASSVNMLMSLP